MAFATWYWFKGYRTSLFISNSPKVLFLSPREIFSIFIFHHISTSQKSDESSKIGEELQLPPGTGLTSSNHNQIVRIFANFLSELLSQFSGCRKDNLLFFSTVTALDIGIDTSLTVIV